MMFANPLPVLKGPHVMLRRPVSADIEARLAIGLHAEIVRAYGGSLDPAQPFRRQHAEEAIASLTDQPYAWVIDAEGFIGHVRFHNVDAHDRRAGLAIGIEDPTRLDRGLIGFDDETSARNCRDVLRRALWQYNLHLNEGKTKIERSSMFFIGGRKHEIESFDIPKRGARKQRDAIQRLMEISLHH